MSFWSVNARAPVCRIRIDCVQFRSPVAVPTLATRSSDPGMHIPTVALYQGAKSSEALYQLTNTHSGIADGTRISCVQLNIFHVGAVGI